LTPPASERRSDTYVSLETVIQGFLQIQHA
jgi:hypothetical protein